MSYKPNGYRTTSVFPEHPGSDRALILNLIKATEAGKKCKKVGLRVTPEVYEALKRIADKEKVSVSDVIRMAIYELTERDR